MDVWVGVRDPRQAKKLEHDLVELLVVAVCAVLSGADTFAEIEAWAEEKLDWLRKCLRLAPVRRKGGLKTQLFIAATSDTFRAELLDLV